MTNEEKIKRLETLLGSGNSKVIQLKRISANESDSEVVFESVVQSMLISLKTQKIELEEKIKFLENLNKVR